LSYRLLVFDWDGTLVDSSAAIATAVRRAAAEAELPVPSTAAARSIIGLGLTEVGYNLFPGADAAGIARFAEAYKALYWAAPQSFTIPFAGVDELLGELSGEFSLAVATGKGRRGLDSALDRTGLGRHLATSRTADETQSKPHPQMLDEIMGELEVDASETLMIGDTSFDMAMATAVSVDGVGVLCGSHSDEALRGAGAVAVLDQILDLQAWLAARLA
jgi:phosphoglycolate phosphatase